MLEKNHGIKSQFYPYLQSLPKQYSNPYFCTKNEKSHLPQYILSQVQEQEIQVLKNFNLLQNSIYQVEEKDWSLAMFEWAWFTVNTRAVYLDYDPRLQNKSNKFLSEDSLGTEIKV